MRGRRAGIITSFGIGAAIFFHAAYTVAGIGLLVAHSLLAFNVLKWAGAAYLFYVGVKTWRAPPPSYQVDLADAPAPAVAPRRYGDASDFTLGFLTNALNPKAVLFFLSIFTTVVSPTTPQSMQMGYAAGMAGLLVVWFTLSRCSSPGGRCRRSSRASAAGSIASPARPCRPRHPPRLPEGLRPLIPSRSLRPAGRPLPSRTVFHG